MKRLLSALTAAFLVLCTALPTLLALPILTTAVVYFLPVFPTQSFASHPLYITAMMLAVDVGYLLYIYTFYRSLVKISCLLKEQAKAELLETEITSYRQTLEAAKQTRHDEHHHNALLLELLQQGDTAGALEYLHRADQALDVAKPEQFTLNPVADAVLRIYSCRAKENGIAYAVAANFPDTLPMSGPELGAMLSNLLENAVDACKKVEPAQRSIALEAETDGNNLRLEIRNSVSGTVAFVDGMPTTTKPDGGTGTRSVANIVRSHGGMLRFMQQGEVFYTQIILAL